MSPTIARARYETFEIAKGSVDCVIDGKHFIATEGDLLHVPPYTAHGFVFLEEGTIWRELFQEMDMSGGIFEKNIVNAYYEPMKKTPRSWPCTAPARPSSAKSLLSERGAVDHKEVFQCRTPDFAWMRYEGEGYSLKLKVCKFETGGCKEIWYATSRRA